MSGLNVLLWTISIILILGATIAVASFFIAIANRNKAAKEAKGIMDRLHEAQTKQEELLRKANKKYE